MSFDESFYVAVAFVVVIGLFLYLRLPQRVLGALDDKSNAIAEELKEAQALREEAARLLASYKEQGKKLESQAEEIIANARLLAERQSQESREAMQRQIARRTKQAEERIARAEDELSQEIRTAIASLAVEASRILIAQGLDEKTAQAIIDENIATLTENLQ